MREINEFLIKSSIWGSICLPVQRCEYDGGITKKMAHIAHRGDLRAKLRQYTNFHPQRNKIQLS